MNAENLLATLLLDRNTPLSAIDGESIKQLALTEAISISPADISGVYLLFHRGTVVYVGQSKCVYGRINSHIQRGVKVFDSFAAIRVPEPQRITRERQLIFTFRPVYNTRRKKIATKLK